MARDARVEADLLAALQAAYTFISQPQRMTRETATYRVHNYNALTAQIRAAIRAASPAEQSS